MPKVSKLSMAVELMTVCGYYDVTGRDVRFSERRSLTSQFSDTCSRDKIILTVIFPRLRQCTESSIQG